MVNIRLLQKSDDEQMLKLMHEFWMDYRRGRMIPDRLDRFEELIHPEETMVTELKQYHKWLSFVAEEDQKVVGFIVGKINDKSHKVLNKQGYIEEFFVTEGKRGKGIGTMLFNKIVEEFKKHNCNHLGTDGYVTNTKALEYYRKLGFQDRIIGMVRII